MTLPRIIAIDGPAASGKSTLALRIAQHLNYLFFDTGVMYRAVTWSALQRNEKVEDEAAMTRLAQQIQIDVRPASISDGRMNDVLVDGQDVTWAIRDPAVEEHVSTVSAYAGVRQALTLQQRRIGQRGQVVMVGRDIGTVVLPEADFKIYLDASVEERAWRRYRELSDRGQPVSYEDILQSMQQRDHIDASRKIAPLRPAEDALILHSDHLSADQVLEVALYWITTNAGRQPVLTGQIALITILTDRFQEMTAFYRDVLGFKPLQEMGGYVEFEHGGVRFAICTRSVLLEATHHAGFLASRSGQPFELAFPLSSDKEVDRAYIDLLARGATPISPPANMPWGQRTAFFADPEGNIHEIFADLSLET